METISWMNRTDTLKRKNNRERTGLQWPWPFLLNCCSFFGHSLKCIEIFFIQLFNILFFSLSLPLSIFRNFRWNVWNLKIFENIFQSNIHLLNFTVFPLSKALLQRSATEPAYVSEAQASFACIWAVKIWFRSHIEHHLKVSCVLYTQRRNTIVCSCWRIFSHQWMMKRLYCKTSSNWNRISTKQWMETNKVVNALHRITNSKQQTVNNRRLACTLLKTPDYIHGM